MCGIAGWVDWQRDLRQQRNIIEAMGTTLCCRGPDSEGTWISKQVGFAHRRLVVVDPVGGHQPMVRGPEDTPYVLIYNGELYNTEDIRQELFARGHSFLGHSDTEVLLRSFMEWGPGCLERLNGIFAFAVWNEAEQTLFVARDRFGVKPLFYALRENGIIFGSELKALLKNPLVLPVVDKDGLAEVFVLGPGRTPGHGVFKGVEELKPGHFILFSRGGFRVMPYWSLESHEHPHSLEETVETIRSLLEDTITRQLVSDMPVCTFLSGGLDSSVVTAMAAIMYSKWGRDRLHTYSVDYKGNSEHFASNAFEPDPDRPFARLVSRYYDTVHHEILLDNDELANTLMVALLARDLPGMADVDSSLYLLCREVKKDATVALSGECADELFGGYPWFRRDEDLKAKTFPWARRIATKTRLLSHDLVEMVEPEYYMVRRYREALDEVPRLKGESPAEARMREVTYLTLTRWMPILLDRKDRMSMATGLEVRVPYCDHRLAEYVWNIPWHMKDLDGVSKGILRRAVRDLLPEEVVYRKKSPYPKTHDPNYNARVRKWIMDIISDPSSRITEFLNVDEVVRFATAEGEAFDVPFIGQLMRGPQLMAYLIQVENWLRTYDVSVR